MPVPLAGRRPRHKVGQRTEEGYGEAKETEQACIGPGSGGGRVPGAVVGLALLSSKPKEPEKAAAEGDRLMASEQPGMFKEAEKCYMQAMKDASASNDTIKYNKYVLKHAQCQYKQASTVKESTRHRETTSSACA